MSRKERRHAKMMARINALAKPGSGDHMPAGPEVDFFFADDSRQRNPSRPGMGHLIAIGGINVPAEEVGEIGRCLDNLCAEFGFPPNEEFKWSPGREFWMRNNLIGERRQDFFLKVLGLLAVKDVVALVVVEDVTMNKATSASTPEMDVTSMFLERVDQQCGRGGSDGFVIVDRPGGDRTDEDTFLANCLETLQSGTKYVKPTRIAHNVLSTPSKLSRLLQVADLVTSCTLSMVAGETQYAPPVFEAIKPLLDQSTGRVGGYGLKLHPDYKFANLYYWLVGDTHYWRRNAGFPMPLKDRPYSDDPFKS